MTNVEIVEVLLLTLFFIGPYWLYRRQLKKEAKQDGEESRS